MCIGARDVNTERTNARKTYGRSHAVYLKSKSRQ